MTSRKDLRLIKPAEPVETDALDRATGALRMALESADIGDADHEAILALTLGDDVFSASSEEREQAAALSRALSHGSSQGSGHPLAELAGALRAVHAAAEAKSPPLATADHEALLAFTVSPDAALEHPERREAAALARALAGNGDAGAGHPLADLALSLRAAASPSVDGSHLDAELCVALAVGVAAEVSPSEEREAASLAAALDGQGAHPLAELAGALRAAASPRALDQLGHERIIRGVLARALSRARTGRGMVLGAIVALAAGFALFFGSMRWLESSQGASGVAQTMPMELMMTRSTSDLFDPAEPFPVKGNESQRLEKIVSSRAADLRANRFNAWGVR